jgi:hypothetical protein
MYDKVCVINQTRNSGVSQPKTPLDGGDSRIGKSKKVW